MLRIGSGFDVHRFASKSQEVASITLAGIEIPHTHSLEAHSDGDVLSHALCDALLGALALGDIGQHFPDTDPQFKNISSLLLLQEVYQLIVEQGWILQNADITIIAEKTANISLSAEDASVSRGHFGTFNRSIQH